MGTYLDFRCLDSLNDESVMNSFSTSYTVLWKIVLLNFGYSKCLTHDIGSFSTAGYGLLDQKRTFMSTNGISENRRDFEKSVLKLRLTWLILLLLLLTLAENRNICLGVILFLVGNTTLWFQSSVTRWLGIECTTITWRMLSVVFRLRASPLCILVTVWTIARSYRAWVLRH